MKKIINVILWMIPITFLGCVTACFVFPTTLNEFLWAASVSSLHWGLMFKESLNDAPYNE